jgi:hypothetical protein
MGLIRRNDRILKLPPELAAKLDGGLVAPTGHQVTLATQATSPPKLVVQAHTCSVSTTAYWSVQENGEREYGS